MHVSSVDIPEGVALIPQFFVKLKRWFIPNRLNHHGHPVRLLLDQLRLFNDDGILISATKILVLG